MSNKVSRVAVLRHEPLVSIGTIGTALVAAGLRYEYIDLFERTPDLNVEELAGLVVLGGTMNADEVERFPFLETELGWIRRAIHAEVPLLGSCLGAQLMAKALGSRVYANPVKEIGYLQIELLPAARDDRLMRQFDGPRGVVFQWHGDTFALPVGAVPLARSDDCPQQAFRYGRNAYGLQFHLEVTAAIAHAWLDDEVFCGELAAATHDAQALRASIDRCSPAMERLARRVFGEFAAICHEHRSAS